MRKCPYCAEEIQDGAMFCRYCMRKVRGRHKRLIFYALVAAVIAFLYLSNKSHIDFHVEQFRSNFRSICRSFGEIMKDLPEGLKAIKKMGSIASDAGAGTGSGFTEFLQHKN